MKALLDTNAYSAIMRGDIAVERLVERAEKVLVSAVVAGELFYGVHHGSRERENVETLERFLGKERVEFLQVTLTTADRYGRIKAALRRKGRPIPDNDAWIAAHAMEHGASLISYDEHFGHVDGLVWIKP